MKSSRLGVLTFTIALAGLVSIGLSGCTSTSSDDSPSNVTSPSSSATATGATPSPSPSATLSGTPLTLSCTQILSLQDVYNYNPNYSQNPNFTVPSQATPLTKIGGVACGWVNQTSGDTFAVAVAKPDAASLATIADATATTYTAVPTYGTSPIEGYFGLSGSIGVATVFDKGYWVVVTSDAFLEPGDAAPLVASVLANLS